MRRSAILTVAALLAGCAGRPVPVAMPIAPPPPVLVARPSPAATPINARLSPAATLWHLRAGLNVAALACRDDATVVPRYNVLLATEAARLKAAEAAYAEEFRATGEGWRARYDDAMTRLYNFWAQPHGQAALCAAAATALADPALADDAAARLAALDGALAPPWLEVDAGVLGGQPVRMAAR